MILEAKETAALGAGERMIDYETEAAGRDFRAETKCEISETMETGPVTYEAVFSLPADYQARAGVLIGTYDNSSNDQINIEIYKNGIPRLYYKVNNNAYSISFTKDVRSDNRIHMAIVADGLTASLYLNGALAESVELPEKIPSVTEGYCIGGDNRTGNTQYFKGQVYAVNLFGDARTAEEIAMDRIMVARNADHLLFSKYFAEN